jgi:hypothetical protein
MPFSEHAHRIFGQSEDPGSRPLSSRRLLGIAALGLLAFGFFEIIEATARRAAAVKPAGPRPDQLRDLP